MSYFDNNRPVLPFMVRIWKREWLCHNFVESWIRILTFSRDISLKHNLNFFREEWSERISGDGWIWLSSKVMNLRGSIPRYQIKQHSILKMFFLFYFLVFILRKLEYLFSNFQVWSFWHHLIFKNVYFQMRSNMINIFLPLFSLQKCELCPKMLQKMQ